MDREGIAKIKKIFKMGYLPSRGKAPYYFPPVPINCFGHACFNLTDEIMRVANVSNDLFAYRIPSMYSTEQQISTDLFERVSMAGLNISSCALKEKLNFNEWRVALYFAYTQDGIDDYHFLLQEANGKWSCKFGWDAAKISYFRKLPEIIEPNYKLYGIYKIANPHTKYIEEGLEKK